MTIKDTSNTLIVILGPTGIGKTNLSIKIAQALKTEIVSCDSRQMYRELKIGTAVPEPMQLATVQHHFIGNLTIHDYYNASKFESEALHVLNNIFKHTKYAVLTGGSGLYLDALVKGIDDLPTIDPNLRENLIKRLQTEGLEALQNELQKIDPDYYNLADLKNSKRVLKALEVYYMTGKPYSVLRTEQVKPRPFKIIQIGLKMERAELYQRIDQRVDGMIKAGLVDEARKFYPYKQLNALNTVGYKELFGHFDGTYDLEEAIRLIKRNSRRYAKRQITWWNRDKNIHWFHPEQTAEILDFIHKS
ncbi:MAG: tRNA (adenosine(37)-N6)-dimethylallyltransferase MiaA [Bacteroidetes bacterium HGW-Bacteroidetes-4]|jgi:tRNA dimethylallyltransferase|nr:MAG: tRNA (adenosine(37)-N6)-dimethylallyltransferase MiaA [Bacteroidetes bacterium HGW-Bacteroidetes-4]